MGLSIRWRLTLWNTLALAVVLLGFAALVYLIMSRTLQKQADRKLEAALSQLENDQRLEKGGQARLRYWVEEFLEHEQLFCVVYASDGSPLARTEVLAVDSVPALPTDQVDRRFRDATLPFIGRQRLLEARTRVGGRDVAVVLMAPLAEADHEREHLLSALLLAVPVALLGSAALGYLLARRALLPMERLRRQAEQITAERLDRRVPVINPHDELGRLAVTVNDMIARLEHSFAEIRRFTADASHELRTPLTAIRTEAEVALAKPLDPREQQQLLGSILEECERLTRLTDQLLMLAREDAGVSAAKVEGLDLGELTRGVVEVLRSLAQARGIALTCEDVHPVRVQGDEGRLRQVLLNLVDNAIKYTPAEGRVEVRLVRHQEEAILTVRDTGVGIPPEHLPRVFDRFYRVDRVRSRAEGGSGLGLSIARSIVMAHQGSIDLVSTPSRGTVCTVRLPVDRNP